MEQQRTVTVIPATINPITKKSETSLNKRRVAGYARVSTDKDEQFTSYEAQVDYYTNYIKQHKEWCFIKVYTDEGISGLNTKKREGFNEMISDALDGKIDLIISKSVSRFARNTVDSLSTIRRLKEKGIEVYFEKENIWTFDGKGELLITIMSSLAQEESRSISENVTWGQRKRFSDGKVTLPYKQFLGYEHGENKDDPPVINEEQAKLVRRIYSMFMHGQTPGKIARTLTNEKTPTPSGKQMWRATTINSILTNEKYRGSARLQKKFTVDFLTKTMKKNEGEVPQYYIEHSHEAIIDPIEWDAVQDEVKRRKEIGRAYSSKSVLSAKIVCGDCGEWYGVKTWHSTDKYKTVIWQCNSKYDKDKPHCKTPHLLDGDIKSRFISAYNRLIFDRKGIIDKCNSIINRFTDASFIDKEMDRRLNEMDTLKEIIQKCVMENAVVAQNQEEYNIRYNGYFERYEALKAEYDKFLIQKEKLNTKRRKMEQFITNLVKNDNLLSDFDDWLWLTTVDKVVVQKDGGLLFKFYNGMKMLC